MQKLAIDGGDPVRPRILPYGRQTIEDDDVAAVVDTLRSDWLTTGPKVAEFEATFANAAGGGHAVAVSNGTAALHAAVYALGIGPRDEVIVPTMTFAASANCAVFQGATPVFCDIDPGTLLIDIDSAASKITPKTKAIVAVDFAGQPCDYVSLRQLAASQGLKLIADACHSLGGSDAGKTVGGLADITAFSMHPVKPVTTGEGGMATTQDGELASRMRQFRSHGITSDHRERESKGSWFYEMVDLGYNYRLTDIQCALGITQLRKLPLWLDRRRAIAALYDRAFAGRSQFTPLTKRNGIVHAYHLYVIKLDPSALTVDRAQVFAALRAEGIGVNVHYIPVHLHPYYRREFGTGTGLCPVAEAGYAHIISLPIFPSMTDADVDDVVAAVDKVIGAYTR